MPTAKTKHVALRIRVRSYSFNIGEYYDGSLIIRTDTVEDRLLRADDGGIDDGSDHLSAIMCDMQSSKTLIHEHSGRPAMCNEGARDYEIEHLKDVFYMRLFHFYIFRSFCVSEERCHHNKFAFPFENININNIIR